MNIKTLGQVFTPEAIVKTMLNLRKNDGSVLEPSSGDGAFIKQLESTAVGIEIDENRYFDQRVINADFFDYSIENKFDTIIGNPPYVRFQDIQVETKNKLDMDLFDSRSNLYLFFIYKSIQHLSDNGELIFIIPNNFLKSTSASKLNNYIYQSGTITDFIDLGDSKVFKKVTPNVVIFRFEKNNFSRITNGVKHFIHFNGQLCFTNKKYEKSFSDLFFVKVGAVSGADHIFEHESGVEFVCSYTRKTGKTKKMIYNKESEHLLQHKEQLLNRRIKKFNESNWWEWGRKHFDSKLKRIYVNQKTRNKKPFFTHESTYYDGSILAIFPKDQTLDLKMLVDHLNEVDWDELGFVIGERYIFSQRSLENTLLPEFL
jgi:adenine-specific DNA-methyltransferase